MPTNKGAFKIFRLFGINVYVSWQLLLMAYVGVKYFTSSYSSPLFNVLEILSLYSIILIHEFGHQLACRQVGGQTHDIILWGLGGVAYVSPPQRPGAQLWSIAAGPLVNVILIPILSVLVSVSWHSDWSNTHPDLYELLHRIWQINFVLLIFNMMPVYPLDGGQILRSLLWFVIGRAKSLFVTVIIGFVALAGLAIWIFQGFLTAQKDDYVYLSYQTLIAFFIATSCWRGLREAWALSRIAKLPRHEGFACPSCKTAPPLGDLWRCGKCSGKFDTFLAQGVCPHCGTQFNMTQCLDCGVSSPITQWIVPPKK